MGKLWRHQLQLELFHPPRRGPDWQSLPVEVREQARRLLAQLFQVSPVPSGTDETAASDE